MKQSIRTKITCAFVGLMAMTILGCWLMNTVFLQSYYTYYKRQTLKEIYNEINQLWDRDIFEAETEEERTEKWQEIKPQLQRLTDDYGADFLVVDNSWQLGYSSVNDVRTLVSRLQRYILSEPNDFDNESQIVIQTSFYQNMDAYYLECWGMLDSGYPFIVTIPLESIKESVAISNRFLAYIGIVSILFGSLMVSLISKSITKPIRRLSDISEHISNLDFEVKYEGKETDEIGVLGKNINHLSCRLEETITDLKNANLELKRDIEQKNQIDEMRKEFIANVSHELKTPIALIQGYAEGLRDGITDDPESMAFYCDVIADEADKMNKMVRKLLTLNQMEFGNNQISVSRFELRELIDGVLNNAGILLEQKEITLAVDLESQIFVYGDEFQIEEVLTNYLSNAINHCDGERIISIYMCRTDKHVRIYVENTGTQIPEADLDKVWIKFYKVDKARTREYGGSGIGLSIVKAIMESHNQTYGVANTETGVVFWFELEEA